MIFYIYIYIYLKTILYIDHPDTIKKRKEWECE
jgi:hypothetical protein